MKITDKEVKKLLKQANSSDLSENVRTYPEDEVDDQTEMEIFLNELGYLLMMYEEGGTIYSEDLEEAREFIRETKNGKVIPCWHTIPPVPKYTETQLEIGLQRARNTVNEYNRLMRMAKKLGIR